MTKVGLMNVFPCCIVVLLQAVCQTLRHSPVLRVTLCPRGGQLEISWAGYFPVCRVRQYTCSVGPADRLAYLTAWSAVIHSFSLFGQSDVVNRASQTAWQLNWYGGNGHVIDIDGISYARVLGVCGVLTVYGVLGVCGVPSAR